MESSSWISPKTTKGKTSNIHGLGFFAVENIKKGDVVAVKSGHIIDKKTLIKNEDIIQDSQMQVTDNLYIAPLEKSELQESMIYFNHSCEPNIGIQGQIVVVALRDINTDEELTMDYCTIFNDDTKINCNCCAPNCRKVITGKDWQDKELQEKYGDNFSLFILQKIKQKT